MPFQIHHWPFETSSTSYCGVGIVFSNPHSFLRERAYRPNSLEGEDLFASNNDPQDNLYLYKEKGMQIVPQIMWIHRNTHRRCGGCGGAAVGREGVEGGGKKVVVALDNDEANLYFAWLP